MRLALSLFAACASTALSACGSGFAGGSVSQTPSVVTLSTTSGQTDDFEVIPGGTSPLEIAALAYAGSGPFDTVVPDVTYTWAARYVNPLTDPPSVATYTVGPSPSSFKTCPAVPAITPPVPILVASGTGTASSAYPTFRSLAATGTANDVFVGAVPGVPAPYCLVVQATSIPGSVIGSATVIVSASP